MSSRTDLHHSHHTDAGIRFEPEQLKVQVLGPLRIRRDGREVDAGPKQQRCLLALLLARAGQPVGMDEMIDLLWADTPPASAVNIIHKYIGALRRLMEPQLPARATGAWLVRHGNGYRFLADPDTLDLANFYRLVDMARSSLRRGDEGRALDQFREGLELWSGLCGDNLADSAAAAAVFSAVDQQFIDAAMAAADLALKEGQPLRFVALVRRAASWAPLNEPLHARLILLLGAAGHQVEAFAVYDDIRRQLADDLGLDPGHELSRARQQVLTQESVASEDETRLQRKDIELESSRSENPQPHRPGNATMPLVRPAQLPPDLPTFVGRASESAFVARLQDQRRRHPQPGPLVVALSGMGGVGKSTFAVHLAHANSPQYEDGQLYLDLRGFDGAGEGIPTREALEVLLHSLGVPAGSVPDRIDVQIGMYRSLTAEKSLVILLDNARNIQQVRPLIPNTDRGLVIVTSRTPLAGLAAIEGAHLLPIDLPTIEAAREIITSRLRDLDWTPDMATTDEVIDLCGRLPLALALVAARAAAQPRFSLTAAVSDLRERSSRLEVFGRGGEMTDPRSIFSWSYRQLSAGASRLFRLLSTSMGPTISAPACASLIGADISSTRVLLDELTDSALISEVTQGRYSSHVLVRAYAEELFLSIDSDDERRDATARLVQHYVHSSFAFQVALRPHYPPIRPAPAMEGVSPEGPSSFDHAMSWFAVERQVLVAAVHRATDPQFGVMAWQLALTTQQYFQWSGFFHDWMEVMKAALVAARREHQSFGEANALRSLAGAKFFFGAFDESLDCLERAQELFIALGRSAEIAYVYTNRGEVLARMGRYDEALVCNRKALAIYEVSGNPHKEIRALSQLGHVLMLRGDYEEAVLCLEKGLSLNQEVGAPELEGDIRIYWARMLVKKGDFRAAIDQIETALVAVRTAGQRPLEIDALQVLAEAWLDLKDFDRARAAWQEATHVMQSFQNGGSEEISNRLEQLERRLQD